MSAPPAYNSTTGVRTIGALANGATATLDVVARLNVPAQTMIAQVSASGAPDPDSTPNNNSPAEDDQASVRLDPPGILVTGPCTLIDAIIAADNDAPAGGCPA